MRASWAGLRVDGLASPSAPILKIGQTVTVSAQVFLAGLAPDDVAVELYHGPLSSQGEIGEPRRAEMLPRGRDGDVTLYGAEVTCDRTGRQGYTARILPKHRALVHPFLPGLVKWG